MESSTATAAKSADERKALLARAVADQTRQGWRVESQSDYQTIMVKGRHVKHILHLVLTLLTGVWGIVWLTIWLLYRERRAIVTVDEYGNTNVER
jgi:hypothetical protein